MSTQNAIVVFLLGLAVGGIAVYASGLGVCGGDTCGDCATRGDEDPAGSPLAAAPTGDGPTLEGAPEVVRLRGALADAQSAHSQATRDLEEARAEITRLTTPQPRDPTAFRFGLPQAPTPNFDDADWSKLSGHMTALAKILSEVPAMLARGEQPGAPFYSRVIPHNTPLSTLAVGLAKEVGAEDNANEAYTHPAVLANLIRAALQATDAPLTQDQEVRILTLGEAWEADVARQERSFGDDTLTLERMVAEVDSKLRFLDAVKNVLSDEQRATLFPPETEGRAKLDLLSPGLAFLLQGPVLAPEREKLETDLMTALLGLAGIKGEGLDLAPYAWIARDWVDGVPGALTPMPSEHLDVILPHVERVQAQARAQAVAIRKVLALNLLNEAQALALRNATMIYGPQISEP